MTSDDLPQLIFGVASRSRRRITPCGDSSMVWRVWGTGRPLILLHGASGSWTHWIQNVGPLAARFTVCAADMPGFGDSDSVPEPHTAEGLAERVAAGLEVLLPAPATVDIAGFSFGGIVGGLVAASLGRRVRTLILIGPGGLALPHTRRRLCNGRRRMLPTRPAQSTVRTCTG